MPLIYNIGDTDTIQIGVWRISETLDFLKENTYLTEEELEGTDKMNSKVLRQWYACRHCLQTFFTTEEKPVCLKDEFGKPYLVSSALHISFSHSSDMAAVTISTNRNGVDIQKRTAKVDAIKHKFLHPTEFKELHFDDALLELHIYWGAKESMYKAHGRKRLSFANDLRVASMAMEKRDGSTLGSLQTAFGLQSYIIKWSQIDNYILVHATSTI